MPEPPVPEPPAPAPPAPDAPPSACPGGAPAADERVPLVRAAVRILVEAAVYRIRKHEAGNLLGTVSLLIARGATIPELAVRTTFAGILNLFIYLFNDLFDVRLDLASPGKDPTKSEFLSRHRRAAAFALALMFVVLLAMALLHARILVVALLVCVALDFIYSGWLKRVAFVDVVLNAAWGFSMTLCGVLERDLAHSLKLAGFLGLVAACFEVIQVIRDAPTDRAAGLRTTGTVLGTRGSRWLFRVLALGTGAYAVALLHSWAALALVLALLLPLAPARASRTWDLARVLFGLVWIALLLRV
ncbi:MAG: UbiA family prenyltransferase [Deltaproteobacteria bacterium]|nr:UbiA family prenyltransferase [Deltaproteobacteria bacterium]